MGIASQSSLQPFPYTHIIHGPCYFVWHSPEVLVRQPEGGGHVDVVLAVQHEEQGAGEGGGGGRGRGDGVTVEEGAQAQDRTPAPREGGEKRRGSRMSGEIKGGGEKVDGP